MGLYFPVLLIVATQVAGFLLGNGLGPRYFAGKSVSLSNAGNFLPKSVWRFSLFVGAILIGLFVLEKSDQTLRKFPLLFQFNLSLACWLILSFFAAAFSGLGYYICKLNRDRVSRRRLIALQLFYVFFGCCQYMPIYDHIHRDSVRGGVVLQTTPVSCGAASLANVARHFNLHLSERAAARLLRTTLLGSNAAGLRYALHELHLPFVMLDNPGIALNKLSGPAILFVDHPESGPESHAVVYNGPFAGGESRIIDPLVGELLWSSAELHARWHGRGLAVGTSLPTAL